MAPAAVTLARVNAGLSKGYSTSLYRTENPISEGSRWINGLATGLKFADVRTIAGLACGTQDGNGSDGLNTPPNKYNDATCLLTGTWANNQQAQATIVNNEISGSWNTEVELRLRSSISANVNNGYEFNVRVKAGATPYIEIIRWNSAVGDFTPLVHIDSSNFALVTGDKIRATAIGSVLTLYLTRAGYNGGNGVGVEFAAATYNTSTGNDGGTGGNPGGADSLVFSSGRPGFGFYLNNQGATGDPTRSGFRKFSALSL